MGPQFPGGFIMQQRYVPGSGFSFAPFGAALGARVPVAPRPVVPVAPRPVAPVVPVAPVAPVAPVSQGQCYTTKGVSGQCTTYQNCGYYKLLEALPKDLPSWALGTKDSWIVPNAKVDRMGVGSNYGLCCPSSSLQNQQQTRVPQQQPQQPLQPSQPAPPQRQWGGQGVYPAGSQPLYPGQGWAGLGGQQGGFPFSPQGFGGGRPQGPAGFGRPQGPPPGQGGFGVPPQGPPPGQGGFGPPQGPPPGQGGQGFGGQGGQQPLPPGTPCNGNCPGFGGQGFGGQPQYPPPAQRPTTQRP